MKLKYLIVILTLMITACHSSKKEQSGGISPQQKAKIYREKLKQTVTIELYDQYTRKSGEIRGVITSNGYILAPLSEVQGAYSAKVIYLGSDITPVILGYVAFDTNLNLVLLRPSGNAHKASDIAMTAADSSVYCTILKDGRISIPRYSISGDTTIANDNMWLAEKVSHTGLAFFNGKNELAAFSTSYPDKKNKIMLVPGYEIANLVKQATKKAKSVFDLRLKSNKTYIAPEKVAGFEIDTDQGNIQFKIYNALPDYKKNMIKLCTDGYYDSLLVHRVLVDFLIQTGACDSKYAGKDDQVGWQGPGYTMPNTIVPGLYHKRGAIAASKLPKYKNPHNRSDGAQFYVISGRKFNDEELNDIEQQRKKKFTPSERNTYKTVGGAPYLDGDYTVFGEVTKGMRVVDYIAGFPTDQQDRPLKDIRIKTVRIVEKNK